MPVDPHHPCKALQSDRHVLERNSPPPLEKHLHCLEDHQVILARVWEMLPGSLFPFPTFSRTLVIWMVLMDSLSNMVTWPKHAQQKQGFSLPRPTLVRQKNWAGRSRLSFWIRNGKKQTQKKKHILRSLLEIHIEGLMFTPATERCLFAGKYWSVTPEAEQGKKISQVFLWSKLQVQVDAI